MLIQSIFANRRFWISAAILGVLGPILIGQYVNFPSMDDSWLSLLVKESGRAAIRTSLHRRIFAELLFSAYPSPSTFKAVGISVSVFLWGVMALQTAALWKLVFPEWKRYAIVAACLSVAPILVQTQLTTLATTIPANLTTACGYTTLLLVWHYVHRGRRWQLIGACLATTAGLIISEYTLAPVLAAVIFVVMFFFETPEKSIRRRCIAGCIGLAVATVAGFAVFQSVADYSKLPNYAPDRALAIMFQNPPDLLMQIPNTIWRAAVGAYAVALATIRLSWGEKSTLAAALYGCILGFILILACGRQGEDESLVKRWNRAIFLGLALCVSLLPEFARQGIFIAGRTYSIEPYSTRFYIPALPVAACVTTWIVLMLVRGRAYSIAIFLMGMIIGNSMFLTVYGEYRKQRYEYALGPLLRPYVEASQGLTVAVLGDYFGREYEVTYKATRDWPVELSKRLLITHEDRMQALFQRRAERSGACESLRTVNVRIGPALYREGQVKLLWVDEHTDGTFNVESYCVPSLLPPDPSQERMVIRTPASAPLAPIN